MEEEEKRGTKEKRRKIDREEGGRANVRWIRIKEGNKGGRGSKKKMGGEEERGGKIKRKSYV